MFDVVNEPSDKHRFSKTCRSCNNRVLLHYSVSINAAAATAADNPLSAAAVAVYIPQSAAAAAYTPRSAAFRLFSRNITVRTRT